MIGEGDGREGSKRKQAGDFRRIIFVFGLFMLRRVIFLINILSHLRNIYIFLGR